MLNNIFKDQMTDTNGYLLHSHSKRNNKFKCNIWRGIALLLNCIDFNDSIDHQVLWVVFIFFMFFCFCFCFMFWFFVPLENFSLIWRRHHCRWRAANFDLSSALMAIEQCMRILLRATLNYCDMGQAASVYNGNFRGPVTLTPVAERLAEEVSLPVLSQLGFEHPSFFKPNAPLPRWGVLKHYGISLRWLIIIMNLRAKFYESTEN